MSMHLGLPADARRRMARSYGPAQDGRSARPGPEDTHRRGVSINEAMANVITSGRLDPDRVGDYIGRIALQGLLNDAGCPCNRNDLKLALEQTWRIQLRKTDRVPSTADLREALADGRISVGLPARREFRELEKVKGRAETRDEKIVLRDQVQRMITREESAISADEEIATRAVQRMEVREALVAEMKELVDELNKDIIVPIHIPEHLLVKVPNTREN